MQSKVKTFRELVEAMNKKRPKYDPSPDDENTNFYANQTVAGEQKFRDAHVVKTQDEPEENGPAGATTPKSNKQGASLGRSGEDSRPKQGSSNVPTRYKSIAAFTAQTPARRGDADNVGDIKPVVLSPSAVNPKNGNGGINYQPANLDANNKQDGDREVVRTSKSAAETQKPGKRKAFTEFKEELELAQPRIATPFDAMLRGGGLNENVTFASGETCVLDEEAAELLRSAFDMLDEEHKEKFMQAINESIDSLVKIIQFVQSEIEE